MAGVDRVDFWMMNRKNFEIQSHLPGVESATWFSDWREVGEAQIRIPVQSLSETQIADLIGGNRGIIIERAYDTPGGVRLTDNWVGFVAAATIQSAGQTVRFNLNNLVNEVIALGGGDGFDREVYRVFDQDSRDKIGIRERLIDVTSIHSSHRTTFAQARLDVLNSDPVEADFWQAANATDPILVLELRDYKDYIRHRVIDTQFTGVDDVVFNRWKVPVGSGGPAESRAHMFVRNLIFRELYNPPDGFVSSTGGKDRWTRQRKCNPSLTVRNRRDVDFDLEVSSGPGLGTDTAGELGDDGTAWGTNNNFRWNDLWTVIQTILTRGRLGLTATREFDPTTRFADRSNDDVWLMRYDVFFRRDRTTGDDRVLASTAIRQNLDDFNIQPGDLVELVLWGVPDGTEPTYGAEDHIVTRRISTMQAGRGVDVRYLSGHRRSLTTALEERDFRFETQVR